MSSNDFPLPSYFLALNERRSVCRHSSQDSSTNQTHNNQCFRRDHNLMLRSTGSPYRRIYLDFQPTCKSRYRHRERSPQLICKFIRSCPRNHSRYDRAEHQRKSAIFEIHFCSIREINVNKARLSSISYYNGRTRSKGEAYIIVLHTVFEHSLQKWRAVISQRCFSRPSLS